jgi:hypothetical protein
VATLQYTVKTLPPVWPGQRRANFLKSPFKTRWTATLELLAREIKKLGGTHVEIAVDLPRGEYDLRADGQLRADARPRRAVIVSFRTPDGSRLQFPCDTYGWWQDNVYAIAKTLENLRAIDRWGATQSRQYEGFKALASGTAPTMSSQAAAEIIGTAGRLLAENVLADAGYAKTAVRNALFHTHPDRNDGQRGEYDRVDAARKVLSAHHGVSL